jgi:hypothetical protein
MALQVIPGQIPMIGEKSAAETEANAALISQHVSEHLSPDAVGFAPVQFALQQQTKQPTSPIVLTVLESTPTTSFDFSGLYLPNKKRDADETVNNQVPRGPAHCGVPFVHDDIGYFVSSRIPA